MNNDIKITQANEHNLKNISLSIPKQKLVVLTGPSGSGKSSLAFDTIYMEGRRRFLDSLSVYARQFVGELKKANVKNISGLSPTIAIDQGTATTNPRSTVGTITEIYDYMRLLWGRAGTQFCPKCNCNVASLTPNEILEQILQLPTNTKCLLLAPIISQRKGEFEDLLAKMIASGYTKIILNGVMTELNPSLTLKKTQRHDLDLVIDRLIIKDGIQERLKQSLEQAFIWSKGTCAIKILEPKEQIIHYSTKSACPSCGASYPEISPNALAFNSPQGACTHCEGIGTIALTNPSLLFDDDKKSLIPENIKDSVFLPWASADKLLPDLFNIDYFSQILQIIGIDPHQPWNTISDSKKKLLIHGIKDEITIYITKKKAKIPISFHFPGLLQELHDLRSIASKDSLKTFLDTFVQQQTCPKCQGKRLKPESQAVHFAGKSIDEIHNMTVDQATHFFNNLQLTPKEQIIAKEVIPPLLARLKFVQDVGLSYLQLSRSGPTLSGGESQRIRLASQLGSELTAVTYILDEPSIGLHPRDQDKLINILCQLRDRGNSILVVEHDEATMRAADYIIDFGPRAGKYGGEIIFQGPPTKLPEAKNCITADYLLNKKSIPLPKSRRNPQNFITIKNAHKNNLKNIDINIPLACLTLITGVSGSGKSTLINEILLPALHKHLNKHKQKTDYFDEISGLESIKRVIEVDQKPIGRTPRSNPATYTKVFDPIRAFFATLPDSKLYGYTPSRFSFNVSGPSSGRCEHCQGSGIKVIEMRFLSNTYLPCEACNEKRFNDTTLRVRYKAHSIADVLNLSFNDALTLFEDHPLIAKNLQTVIDVGLGYLKLGQPSPTLSGGESQRIKLSRELARPKSLKTIYILDEPTTGLHFEDIRLLLNVLQNLTDQGHSVIVIEHNLELIKSADYIIDLGPDAGINGGNIVATGTPEQIAENPNSLTGKYLKPLLK